MKPYESILVGIDFSESAKSALRAASRIAVRDGARVTAVHIVNTDWVKAVRKRIPELKNADFRERTEAELDAFIKASFDSEGATVSQTIVMDHPFAGMLHAIEKEKPDLLVMGSRGVHQDSRVTGILAKRMVRKAPVKVLLVRAANDKPYRKVVACVDFSDTSRLAIEQAIHIAKNDGAELHLVHVLEVIAPGCFSEPILSDPVRLTSDRESLGVIERQIMNEIDSFSEAIGDLAIKPVVKDAFNIGQGVVDYLNESQADLAVLGTRGRTGLKALLLGTVAEKVVYGARCSVLSVKPKGFHYQL